MAMFTFDIISWWMVSILCGLILCKPYMNLKMKIKNTLQLFKKFKKRCKEMVFVSCNPNLLSFKTDVGHGKWMQFMNL